MIDPFRFLIHLMKYGRHLSFCGRLRRIVTVEWVRPYIKAANRILEVGAGDGQTTCFLARRFQNKDFVVCEKNEKQLEKLSGRMQKKRLRNVRVVKGSLAECEELGLFDFLFAVDVLEHIEDDYAALVQMKALLKSGDNLFLHVPACGVDVFDDPDHVRPGYEQEGLSALLAKAGFEIKRMEYTFGRRGVDYHHSRIHLSKFRRAMVHLLDLADDAKVKSSIGVVATKAGL